MSHLENIRVGELLIKNYHFETILRLFAILLLNELYRHCFIIGDGAKRVV
jgi:hypothetical protein